MGEGHNHHGGRRHGTGAGEANQRRLLITLILSGGYMVAEFLGGLITNSLALLADAGHMLSDVGALGLSLFALWFARRPPTPRRTYGYYRAEILAALVNAATLIGIALLILVEAYRRFREPPEIRGAVMMGIATGGLAVNLIGLWILNPGKSESLNVHGAWLHVLTDALGSIGAIVAGLLIWHFGWNWIDPATSALIALLVIYSSWALLEESVAVLMEGTPRGIDVDDVRDVMISTSGVVEIHDLHIWTITSGMDTLSAHVVAAKGTSTGDLLRTLHATIHDRFGIDHVTLQIEPHDFEEQRPKW